ncbi:efflux RND transporter permease subunit [Bdellovibrio bacteriovorus]|uniref:efflux RND transporter permease subunit n=1 Tax=Bdellovibrio bacteriovorus TaxID=959 RepID=UPI003461EFD4
MGQGLDLYSLIGFLLLLGVATKNSILIVYTVAERLREIEAPDFLTFINVVVEAGVRRLRPIIMTSMGPARLRYVSNFSRRRVGGR